MSSKGQDKKNFGQFNRGKPNNRGKKPQFPKPKSEGASTSQKCADNSKTQHGKKDSNKHFTSDTSQQKLNVQKAKAPLLQTVDSYLSSLTPENKFSQSSQSTHFTQINVNIQSSSFVSGKGARSIPSIPSSNASQVRGNNRRVFAYKGPNVGIRPSFPHKEQDDQARVRLITGSKEFSQPFYRPRPPYSARGNRFHSQRPRHPAPLISVHQPTFTNQPNQQTNVASNSIKHDRFHSQRPRQSAPFISANPSFFENQHYQQSTVASDSNKYNFGRNENANKPNFFKHNTTEHKKFSNNKGNKETTTSNAPSFSATNTQYTTVRTPVFKFKKNKRVKNVASEAKVSGAQHKIEKQQNSKSEGNQQKRYQQKKQNWTRKKTPNLEVKPIFTFQHISSNNKPEVKESIPWDDEEGTTLSRCSSKESIWTTNLSDDNDEEDDVCSSESDVTTTSELSLSSSVQGSEISDGITSKLSYISKQERYISVFWDIENCPVPHGKSAVDFVKRVRTTLYNGRTEKDFYVVCDITKLSVSNDNLADQLNLSNVSVMHVSNKSKNAADSKIMSFLIDFPTNHKGHDSAVVLISGDSDFASILNKLNYKHRVYIYLICKANAQHSLIEAANECIFYEKFINDLPSRSKDENIEYLVVVSDFPQSYDSKKAKNYVYSKLKNVNCRVKTEDMKSVTVIHPDEYAREKTLALLEDISLEGQKIQCVCKEREKSCQVVATKEIKTNIKKDENSKDKNVEGTEKNSKDKNARANEGSVKSSLNKENVPIKKATLCVFVSTRLKDVDYWKSMLEVILNFSDFSLQWEGSSEDGMLLVSFESLSKAQKAKKVLQKRQQTDTTCPKFLKLIKQDGVLDSLNMVATCQDINRKKIQDFLSIMDKKKEDCLKKHRDIATGLAKLSISAVPKAAEAKAAKLNELNEQKVAFINFAEKSLDKVKKFDLESKTIDETFTSVLQDFSRECNCLLATLPIYAKKNIILKKIKTHQAVVVCAETGSGKSTQLTQYLWREGLFDDGIIVCTQPHKIAAITLAKHVSSQIGCSLGDIVGYQVGMTAKRSKKTSILYVTDFTMISMIVNDLKDIACIIIDEAQERTVYTDLLFGMIKNCLKIKPKLKIIITLHTKDVSIFKSYLNLRDEAIVEVSGRTFPVEDVWLDQDVALGWDYFKKTIDIVCSILNQDAGDVLAFLTTPFETEKAVQSLSERIDKTVSQTVKVLQLHEMLDMQEQQKIFEHTPDGVRKIVFASNYAETSVTIPGIKYVVDCGLVKESQYNPVGNMNVMSVHFISQSSAEQRRGLAGRIGVGKCYRLYSKANYDKMVECSPPEILRVHLGEAMLKLMKLGIKDPLQFEFIQSPPQESLNSAIKQLTSLKALNEDDLSLSELGEKMSYLPVEPRLSFMILTGIDLDIGYEAIVLTAMVTVSRNIYFRSVANKAEADSKKMQFCNESDFFTLFDVYKEWATVPKQSKSKWCAFNCINARSLKTAHELINELLNILDKEAKIKIASKFNDGSVHNELNRLIFRSFYHNLCIFSGYLKFGYKSLNISKDLLVHTSSSLHTYGQWRPDYLVYDILLQTDHTYLINVSPVTEEMMLDCISANSLTIHLESLKALKLTTYKISPVGKSIILQDIIGKQGIIKRQLENQLKTVIGSEQVAVEIDLHKGEIKVHGPPLKYDVIESILCPMILKGQERLLTEERDVFIYPEICAIISAGVEIKDIVLCGEFREVKVCLNTDIEISTVVEKLQTCGPICEVCEWKNYFKVTFLSPLSAKLALKEFENEKSFTIQKLVKANPLNSSIDQYKVYVSFIRRPCTGEAFLSIDPPSAETILIGKTIYYQGLPLQCSSSKKTSDVRIVGLPPDAQNDKLEKIMNEYITGENKLTKCLVVKKKNYESTPSEITEVKKKLFLLFAEFTPKDKLTIELKKPADHESRWHANVYFPNAIEGESAVSVLKNRGNLALLDLQLKPMLQTSLYCKLEVFWAVKKQIDEALKYFSENSLPDNTLEINGFPSDDNKIKIQIVSNNISDMLEARKSLMGFILGDSIECYGNETLEKLFSNAGQEFLKKISDQRSDCYIELNFHKKTICIFGDVSTSNFVKLEINEFLGQLKENSYEEIHLTSESGKPGVLRRLLQKYGHDLGGLKDICELKEIIVDSQNHILEVKGSISSVAKCQDIVQELKTVQDSLEDIAIDENTESCPVCFDQVSDNFHRLECCGHAYCKDCILHWFHSTTGFPLSCMICESQIVLEDIQWASKEVKSLETEIFKKSLSSFLASRDDVSYCPSPDCSMVFRIGDDGDVFVCPICNNSICTTCNELYHFGISCSLYQCSNVNTDYSLEEWMAEKPNEHKCCPTCFVPIEKNGECPHMTCYKCNCHMCWLCLEVFPPGNAVFDHQPFCTRKHV